MTPDKLQALSSLSTRQKVIAGILILVVLFLIWQLKGMFGGGKSAAPITPTSSQGMAAAKTTTSAGGGMEPVGAMMPQPTPKPANVPQTIPTPEAEAEIMRIQQQTQAQYLKALNELQILKVTKDIAVTNKDISAANLAKVLADKQVIDLLAPPAPPTPSETIKTAIQMAPSSVLSQEVKYNVISVSQLQYRWGAVLSYKGNLYNVHVGDILPPDGSTVVVIGKDGVILEKNGIKIKISLVPII